MDIQFIDLQIFVSRTGIPDVIVEYFSKSCEMEFEEWYNIDESDMKYDGVQCIKFVFGPHFSTESICWQIIVRFLPQLVVYFMILSRGPMCHLFPCIEHRPSRMFWEHLDIQKSQPTSLNLFQNYLICILWCELAFYCTIAFCVGQTRLEDNLLLEGYFWSTQNQCLMRLDQQQSYD